MAERTFSDLPIFQETYRASLAVMTWVIPYLPQAERDDLGERLRRSAAAIPCLIAAASEDNRRGGKAKLGEAAQHCRETIVMLLHCRDLYARSINGRLCQDLIALYQRSSSALTVSNALAAGSAPTVVAPITAPEE